MITNNNIFKEGFTLTEMLVNIIIITTLTFSTLLVFFQIQKDINLEENKSDMIVYANTVLDDLELELSRSERVIRTIQSSNNTSLELYYPNDDSKIKYLISLERGLFKDDRALDTFNPNDDQNRLKYRISEFNISQPTLTQGDIFSSEANEARYSSYNIILEINLYNSSEKIIETLKFKRRVFSPAKFIYNKKINNA
jgi:type II secretory pathway pseudopilin PulG